ncbi:MAG: hypothetical protein ACOYVF_02235 [Candidatus Zixiibacteriota bacterium]
MLTNNGHSLLRPLGQLLQLLVVIFGIVTAYFMTIQSLKVELAEKAERVMVETLDKKLTNFEVILTEGVVSKDDFHQFSREVDRRLARIEYILSDKSGENLEKR